MKMFLKIRSYKFDMLISDESIKERPDYNSWNNNNYYGYIKLNEQATVASLSDKLEVFAKKYTDENTKERFPLISYTRHPSKV